MVAACFGVMIVAVYRSTISYEAETSEIDQKHLELASLITVDKFTVKCTVPDELYELT